MSSNGYHEELIKQVDLFIDLESSLETFYEQCAKIFPDEKYAWYGIATQEGIHAKIFKKIKEYIDEQPEKWSIGKYNYDALKTMVDSVHEMLFRIKAGDYKAKVLINFARDVESSLVESDIANAFISEKGEYSKMVKKILEETCEHKEFINRFLESL